MNNPEESEAKDNRRQKTKYKHEFEVFWAVDMNNLFNQINNYQYSNSLLHTATLFVELGKKSQENVKRQAIQRLLPNYKALFILPFINI